MKKLLYTTIFTFCIAFSLSADNTTSGEAIKILLNTRASGSPAIYEKAAEQVAEDAKKGKILQRFLIALISREKNAPFAARLNEETRRKYLDSTREKIRALAERRNNAMAYYLLSMEANDLDMLKKAADLGNVQAMNAYATISLSRAMDANASTNAMAEAMKTGYEYFSKAAARGDANGYYNLGMCYMRGYSVAIDPEKAFECFQAAAKHDHPEALNNIGGCYRDGIVVQQDYAEAAHWFARSADLGNPYGELNYALALLRGEGVMQDDERAVRMLKDSAQHGNIEAMNIWAECLHIGRGTPQDVATAIKLYRKAAEGGLAAAMDNYADCWERGNGVPQNQKLANIWRMKARAVRGDRNAAAWLRQNDIKKK